MTIKEALESETSLPAERLHYSGTAPAYITFFEYDEDVENCSNDEIETTGHYIQVDLWIPENTDYISLKPKIKSAMKMAGFYFTNAQELHEDETKKNHWASRYVASEYIEEEI
jgi:hypothetical protein